MEIKTGVYYYEDIEEKTLELIRKYHLEDRVMFSSFNHLSLERMKELAPDIPRGALLDMRAWEMRDTCSRFGYDFYHPGIKGLTENTVKNCRDHGIGVNVWTINDMESLENTYEWGCSGIFTNYPEICRSWVEKKRLTGETKKCRKGTLYGTRCGNIRLFVQAIFTEMTKNSDSYLTLWRRIAKV